MIIANYNEFIQVINTLFGSDEVNDFTSFKQELAKSKTSRNIKRNRYNTELKALKTQINDCKQMLRSAKLVENKRKYSEKLKKLNQTKQNLVSKNREYSELNLFDEMSENAKIYACCRHLFSKYLPQALSEDLSAAAKINDDGSVTVNSQAFKDSRLYQDAAHIKDYVSSYFENYPERIKGTRYFIGLHRKAPTLSDLLSDINAYFEKLNSPSEKESNNIKKSHIGIEIIKTYPEQYLQIVKVTTKAGLKYEGSAMHHCVGSYASKVEKGETQIYSLRDMGESNRELTPHATVELKKGKIAQIKGPHDSIIAFEYVDYVRDMLLTLIKSKNFDDIINDNNIPSADKNNIGIFKDINGNIHDLFNFNEQNIVFDVITITQEALIALPLNKMKIKNLIYRGIVTDDGLQKLFSLKNIENLDFKSLEYQGETFDYSGCKKKDIYLNITAPNLKCVILPKQAKFFSLNGKFDNLENIIVPQSVNNIALDGSFAKLKTLPNSAEKLSLNGDFPALESLPDRVISLGLKGNFPRLKNMNTAIVTNLSIESKDILSELSVSEMPKLLQLSLYGDCAASLKKLPKAPLLESLHIGSGNYELGKQYSDIGDNFTAFYPCLQSLTLNGTFPQIRKLDLSLNKELMEFETLGAKFENMEIIKFPNSLSTCVFDFAIFPKLKELDYSKVNSKKFGKVEGFDIGKLSFGHEEVPKRSGTAVKGLSLSFARFENLETIKFPIIAEDINLQNFSGASNVKKFNFEELTNLKELNLTLAPFDEIPQLDLSACSELKSLYIDGNILNRTVLPKNLEYLGIISVGMDAEMPNVTLDNKEYDKLKTLSCTGFLPDERILKPSIENLTVHANYQNLSNLKQINMGHYKYVDMQMSGSSLSKLEKVIFPQTFKKMSLGDTSDKLTELDFSNTFGEIRIYRQGEPIERKQQISYFKFIRNGIVQEENGDGHQFDNFLILTDMQMENIKHIKLGKDAVLYVYDKMPTAADLNVEIAYDTPENNINLMQRENPHINFIREKNCKNYQPNHNDFVGKSRD